VLRTSAQTAALDSISARAKGKVVARRVFLQRLVERVDLGLRESAGADELIADTLASGKDLAQSIILSLAAVKAHVGIQHVVVVLTVRT